MSRSAKSAASQEAEQTPSRQGWCKPAGETVLAQGKAAFGRAGFADSTLLLRWAEIAGLQIARVARPVKWQEGPGGATLTLKCEAGAIVFLQHQTRELMEHLNAYFGRGRIARLKLAAGRFPDIAEPPTHPAPTSDLPLDKLALAEALARLTEARRRLKTARLNQSGQVHRNNPH